jgi:hypothetical protein
VPAGAEASAASTTRAAAADGAASVHEKQVETIAVTAAVNSAAPVMWRPTRSSGSPVKYWV